MADIPGSGTAGECNRGVRISFQRSSNGILRMGLYKRCRMSLRSNTYDAMEGLLRLIATPANATMETSWICSASVMRYSER